VIGGKAAQSHTASIAGNDAVFDTVLAEFGAVRARTTEEMLDIAHLATRRIYPAGNTLGVLTVSGGAGVLISDAAEDLGVAMPPMPAAAQAKLKALVSYCAPVNPIDCTAQVVNDVSLIGKFAETVVVDGGYGTILSFFTYTGGSPTLGPHIRAQLGAVREKYPDRLFVLSIVAPSDRVAEFEADGFTVFEDPSRALAAIAAMGRFGDAFARPARALPPAIAGLTVPTTTPTEAEAKRLLADAGIPSVPERVARSAQDAVAAAEAIGFPVVMKILSADILHKSEIGGVLLDIADEASVRAGFAMLMDRAMKHAPTARIDGVLVARQLQGGVECLLGINRDPVFGPIAVFGLGGIYVEIMHDVVMRRCPFDETEAEAMIRSIRSVPLLLGARGRRPVDIKALARMLSRLSALGHQADERLLSIDLNPVLAMPEGEGAFAVDAVIEIGGLR
jgi:acetate---CoA ligase (ADP-forming)